MACDDGLGGEVGAAMRSPAAGGRRPVVVVVGSVNRDYVCRVTSLPAPGETVLGAELSMGSGGKGGNQAVAAALMGATTALVACVGADPDGRALLADLEAAGVDVEDVASVAGAQSGAAFVMVADDGENCIVVAPGANSRLDAEVVEHALERRLRRDDVVVVQAEIPSASVEAAAGVAERLGARFVLNLAPYREVPAALLRQCDPLVVNETEARALLGLHTDGSPDSSADAESMAEQLGGRTRSAVITLGAAGAVVAAEGAIRSVPAERVTVVDTTGAGDAFVGALAASLSHGDSIASATLQGVRAGSQAVTRRGAQPPRVT